MMTDTVHTTNLPSRRTSPCDCCNPLPARRTREAGAGAVACAEEAVFTAPIAPVIAMLYEHHSNTIATPSALLCLHSTFSRCILIRIQHSTTPSMQTRAMNSKFLLTKHRSARAAQLQAGSCCAPKLILRGMEVIQHRNAAQSTAHMIWTL